MGAVVAKLDVGGVKTPFTLEQIQPDTHACIGTNRLTVYTEPAGSVPVQICSPLQFGIAFQSVSVAVEVQCKRSDPIQLGKDKIEGNNIFYL